MKESVQPASRGELPRREVMQAPEEVAAMLRLKALGWGVRRIASELGCSHMTVRRYLAAGGWLAYRGRGRRRTLAGLEDWVAERFRRHAGNADVVRQELEREKGIRLTLRTVEREVSHLRRDWRPKRARRSALRRRPASSCRSILASAGYRSATRT